MYNYLCLFSFLSIINLGLSTEVDPTLSSLQYVSTTARYSKSNNERLNEYYSEISRLSICMIDTAEKSYICQACTPIFYNINTLKEEIENASIPDPLKMIDKSYTALIEEWNVISCSKCLDYNRTYFNWNEKALLFFELLDNVTSCIQQYPNITKCKECHLDFLKMKETVYLEDLQCFDIKYTMQSVFKEWEECEVPVHPSPFLLTFIALIFASLLVFYFISYIINSRMPFQKIEYKRKPYSRSYNSINS